MSLLLYRDHDRVTVERTFHVAHHGDPVWGERHADRRFHDDLVVLDAPQHY